MYNNDYWNYWCELKFEDTKKLSEQELFNIFEIERDMWARKEGLWEYLFCNNCNYVNSKEDIFELKYSNILHMTVWQIEKILGLSSYKCSNCGSVDTKFNFWIDYLDSIKERYNKSKSYLVTLRDKNWDIKWFVDWYIDNINTIFSREFSNYYWKLGTNKLIEYIEKEIWYSIPTELFCCTALWTEVNYRNLVIIVDLLREMYLWINLNEEVLGILELRLYSTIYYLYLMIWAKQLNFSSSDTISIWMHNKAVISDIFLIDDVIWSHRTLLSDSSKKIIFELKTKIKSL